MNHDSMMVFGRPNMVYIYMCIYNKLIQTSWDYEATNITFGLHIVLHVVVFGLL